MRIAVVGCGINGAGVAWELVRKGYEVTVFERERCGGQTSSATTKLIHGGLRYLEGMHVGLVRESLRERAWLVAHLPDMVRPVEILLPIYRDSPRSRLEIAALVRIVVASAVRDGMILRENTPVIGLRRDGSDWIVRTAGGEERFGMLINVAGPWMNELLERNGIQSRYRLSLVRGSHLILKRRVSEAGMLLQSISDRRVFFVLPWKGTSLVGTTEVFQRESLDDVHASEEEIGYLIARFNHYVRQPIGRDDIASTFAGVRALVCRASNPSAIGREYRIQRDGNLIDVFGGKMTTFMSLARNVGMRVDNYFGKPRSAREPEFAR